MSRYPELGTAFRAIHENLDELDARQSRLLECRLAHLDEWADTLLRVGGEDRDTLLQLLDALRPDREFVPDPDVPPENREALRQFYRFLAAPERLSVLRTVAERGGAGILTEQGDLPPQDTRGTESSDISEHARGKIAYVQNAFSDNAYLRFSHIPHHPRAAYFDSFSDVCEEVYNGICEYCILPILHERDGKLFRFYSLLQKYELKIVCACDIPRIEKDGTTYTRHALICKHLPPTVPADAEAALSCLELLLPADGTVPLCDLLQAAQLCGLTPERVDTRADSEDADALAYHISFRCPGADVRTFLAFLSLDVPRSTVLGLYSVLTS